MAIINKKEKAEPLAPVVKAEKAAAKKVEKAAAKVEKVTKKRTAASKKAAEPTVKLYVQYMGKQISQEEAVAAVKAAWTGEPIQTLELYVKPEDGAVYYVVNGGESGKVEF